MEAVVAIAVVSIVIVASVTIASQSVRLERDSVRNWEIAVHAENALECYRYCRGTDGLENLLKTADDKWEEQDLTEVLSSFSPAGENAFMFYKLEKPDYIVMFHIISIDSNPNFELKAFRKDGKEIYSLTAPLTPGGG